MKDRRSIAFLVLLAAIATAGCERPFDRTPPGFVEACYGGRADAPRNWVCSETRLEVTVEGAESDWPKLARIVSDFGRNHGLDVFDGSTNIPDYMRTLEISVCSSNGLFLLLDKRIYARPEMNVDGNRITAAFRTYHNSFDWKPLASEFEAVVRQQWPGAVETKWPEPYGPDRELPDGIESCQGAKN